MAAKQATGSQGFSLAPRQIRWQLLLAFVPLAVAAIAAVSFTGYRIASDSLRDQALRQLESVRDNKKREIERYFLTIEDQVITMARNPSTVLALKQLSAATHELDDDPVTETANMRPQMESLKKYLETEYSKELSSKKLELRSLLLPQRSAVYLQGVYVAENPNPTGRKQLMDSATDNTRYSHYHAIWNPVFRTMSEKFGFQDMYLIDLSSGRVVYSVGKGPDFQTSVLDGPYSSSNMANLFRRVQTESREGDYLLFDFAPYVPAHGKPAAFAGSPIFENGQKTGVLIVRVPIDRINSIMTADKQWQEVGLGETGETYLIGRGANDTFMRNDSRFLEELKGSNPEVAAAGTTILSEKIDSEAAIISNDADEFPPRDPVTGKPTGGRYIS